MLFQPEAYTDEGWARVNVNWMVDLSEEFVAQQCRDFGIIQSASRLAACPASPDGDGCVGLWQETSVLCRTGWCPAPLLNVSAADG